MNMHEHTKTSSVPGAYMYGFYVLALLCCLIGNLLIRLGQRSGWLPQWGQVVLACASCLPLMIGGGMFWKWLKQDLDEMFQRVVLEGLAFALIIYVPLAALYLNVRVSGVWTPRLDAPDILMTPAFLVAIGIAISWRRYR